MYNIKREVAICQILLDSNIFPHELNCLIIEYQKTIMGDLVQKIDIENLVNGMVTDNENIYVIDNLKVSIYGKYSGILTNIFEIWDVNDDQCGNTCIAIDDDNIYVATNYKEISEIKIFTKKGQLIKNTLKYSKTYALAVDNEYIYIACEEKIVKYTKNSLKEQSCYENMKKNRVFNMTVDNKYIYLQNTNLIVDMFFSKSLIFCVYDKNNSSLLTEKEIIETIRGCLVCQNGRKLYIYSLYDNNIKVINIENYKTEKIHINNRELGIFSEYTPKYLTIDSEFIYIATQKNIQIYAQ